MSDINITLDSTSAITNAKRLEDALDRLENKAKSAKLAMRKFMLSGNLVIKPKRLITDMKTIQVLINKIPLYARVRLRVDKRSLRGIRTHTGRGAGLLEEAGMKKAPGGGWFASQSPESHMKSIKQISDKSIGALKAEDAIINSIRRTRALTNKDASFHQLRRLSRARTIQKVDTDGAKKRVAVTKILAGAREREMTQAKKIADFRADRLKKRAEQSQRVTTREERALGRLARQHKIATAKPTIQYPTSAADRDIDKAFGPQGAVVPEAQHRWAQKLRGRVVGREDAEKKIKDLSKWDSLTKKISKSVPKSMADVSRSYQDVQSSINALAAGYSKGNIRHKEFISGLKQGKKDLKTLNKEQKKLTKTTRAGRGAFMNFTMALTAVAATMFIWQKLKQLMIKVAGIGDTLSQTFARMRSETSELGRGTNVLVDRFREMSDGTEWGIPKIYEAYKILRKEGLGTNEALKQIIPTLKIARNEDLKLADAARMAAFDTMGLREQYLKLDKEISKTGGAAWKRLSQSMRDLFEAAYMRQEPRIIKILDELGTWIKRNREDVIAGLVAIGQAVINVAVFFTKIGLGIAKFIGEASKAIGFGETTAVEKLRSLEDQYMKTIKILDAKITLGIEAPDAYVLRGKLVILRDQIEGIRKKLFPAAAKIGDILPDKETVAKGWQDIYSRLKRMSERHYEERYAEVGLLEDKNKKMFAKIGDAQAIALVGMAANIDRYNLLWEQQSNYMKQNAELFRFTGKMSDEYYDNLIAKIKGSTVLYDELTEKQRKNLLFLKERAEFNKRQAALAKPHEAVFEETGVMTGWLKKEKLRKARSDYLTKQIRMEETGGYKADVQKSYQIAVLKIESDFYAKRLENQTAYFDATGMITKSYAELQIGEFQRMADSMILQGLDPDKAKDQYDEMVKSFATKLIEPMQSQWEKYHSSTLKMSEQHFAIEQRNILLQYDYMARILGNELAAKELLIEQSNLLRAKELEGHHNVCDGIRAAWLRLAEDAEPLSKMVSDAWVKGASDVEQAWKETFFDTINFEWSNFEQHAIDILKSVRDMLNETAYAMLKSWMEPAMDKLFGFDRAAEAAKTLTQTTALEAQNLILGQQIGVIAALTAAYTALAAAKAATGMVGGDMAISSAWNTVSSWHKGGRVGIDPGVKRRVPSSIFAFAPRLHDGLKQNEFPAILERGEEVTPKGAKQSITINVPVSVEGNERLAEKIRTEVETLVYDIMQEEVR